MEAARVLRAVVFRRGYVGAVCAVVLLSAGCRGAADTSETPPATDSDLPPGAMPGRTVADTDPRFEFDLTADLGFSGLRMLTPAELAQSVKDLTGVTPDVSRLPAPAAYFGLHNDSGQVEIQDVGHMQELLTMA